MSNTSETQIVNEVLLELSKLPGVKVWRNNSGKGYGYGVVRDAIKSGDPSRLIKASLVTFGVVGQADITGIGPGGIKLEIECKTDTGTQSDQQCRFEEMIRDHGGIYLVVRSADEARNKLREAVRQRRGFDWVDDVERLENMVEWFESRSGNGDVNLTREMYDYDVEFGGWTK